MTDTAPPLTDDSGLDEPVEAQPTGWSTVDWRRWMPLAAVIVGVLVAHLPYLLGIFDPNPLLRTSGLGTGIHPGPFPGLDTIDPNTGYISQALTHHAAQSWLHGHVPWWNPFEGLGAPAAGEMSGMAMFLPVVLLAHFAQGEIAMYLLFGLVAAVSTYFLLLRLGLRPWICSAAGIAFGLDGTLAWFRISPANPVCFLPLMLLGLELIRDGVIRGRPTRWWLVALGLAMSVYAGFPEVTYLDGLVVAVWALARLQGLTRGQIRAYALRVGGAALVGVLLAAPLLVAFVDYLSHAYIGGHNGAFANVHQLHPSWSGLFFPYIFGPIFGFIDVSRGARPLIQFWDTSGGYVTAATVVLALAGLWGRTYRALRIGLAVLTLLMLGRMFGVHLLLRTFNLLPGMTRVAAFRYLYPAIAMMVIVLAAFGLQALLQRELRPWAVGVTFALGAGLVLVAAIPGIRVVHHLTTVDHHRYWEYASLAWGAGTVVAVILAGSLSRVTALRFALLALLPVEAIAMFAVPEFSAPRSGQVDLALVHYLQRNIGLDRYYTLGPLQPNYGSYFDISSLNTNDLPEPKAFNTIVTKQLNPSTDAINFTGTYGPRNKPSPTRQLETHLVNYEKFGVKFVLLPSGRSAPAGVPPLPVYQDAVANVYQLSNTRPFWSEPTGRCVIQTIDWAHVSTDCTAPTVLTRLEVYMPGWSATRDGRSVHVVPDRDGMQTVALPAGRSTLTFNFQPPHTALAVAGAIAGALAIAASGVLYQARLRRRRPRHLVTSRPTRESDR